MCNRTHAFAGLSCLFALAYGFSVFSAAFLLHRRSPNPGPQAAKHDALQQKRRVTNATRSTATASKHIQAAKRNRVCSPPAEKFDLPQKGCPLDSASNCVANNRDYATFAMAWAACGAIAECGFVMRWTDGVYYLRRQDDPETLVEGAGSMLYSCGEENNTEVLMEPTMMDPSDTACAPDQIVSDAQCATFAAARQKHYVKSVMEAFRDLRPAGCFFDSQRDMFFYNSKLSSTYEFTMPNGEFSQVCAKEADHSPKAVAVGDDVLVVESGRVGRLDKYIRSDVPFKVVFDDGRAPGTAWYKIGDITKMEATTTHSQLPTTPAGVVATIRTSASITTTSSPPPVPTTTVVTTSSITLTTTLFLLPTATGTTTATATHTVTISETGTTSVTATIATATATGTGTATATATPTFTTTSTKTGEWECYQWAPLEEAELTNDRSGNHLEELCERERGDGFAYGWGRPLEEVKGCGECSCCRKWVDKARRRAWIPNTKYAFVMMAYESDGVSDITWGALAMAKALYQLSRYPMLLLTNTTHFPDGTPLAHVFGKLGARILPVYTVGLPGREAGWTVQHWNIAFWKLQIWRLTQFEKLIWLDSDAILYRSVDWLFDRGGMWAQRDAWFCDLDAEPVCSGIMVLSPSREDFDGLLTHFAEIGSEITHGDQELIERYFKDKKQAPVQLLSPLEASFGQCAGKALSPYLETGGEEFPGLWNIPAFVHKSGGWGDTVSNGYNNVCFIHDLQRQRYYINDKVINVCHYNPLAAYWRRTFCAAAKKDGGLNVDSINEFCNDLCYFRGEMAGDFDCPTTVVMLTGPLAEDPGSIAAFGQDSGLPAPQAVWTLAPYQFKWGESIGTQESTITYHDAVLPPPPFTFVLEFKSVVNADCQMMVGWFGEDGSSVELQLRWGDLVYGEKGSEWKEAATSGQKMQNGEWQSVAVQREVSGGVQLYVGGTLKAQGTVEAQVPGGLNSEPSSSRSIRNDCFWNGQIHHFGIFNFLVKPEVLAEIAL